MTPRADFAYVALLGWFFWWPAYGQHSTLWILKGPYHALSECQHYRALKADPHSGPCVRIESRQDWDNYLSTGPRRNH